jgi:hypothetical protein
VLDFGLRQFVPDRHCDLDQFTPFTEEHSPSRPINAPVTADGNLLVPETTARVEGAGDNPHSDHLYRPIGIAVASPVWLLPEDPEEEDPN